MKAQIKLVNRSQMLSPPWQERMEAIVDGVSKRIVDDELKKCEDRIKARLADELITVVARIETMPTPSGELRPPEFNIILELGEVDEQVEA